MLLRLFRSIALVEGVTTLLLFLVAMPLKYFAGNETIMPLAGWAHGAAFLAYIVTMVPGMWGHGFTGWQWLRTLLASFVPFGTFLNDPMLKRREGAGAQLAAH